MAILERSGERVTPVVVAPGLSIGKSTLRGVAATLSPANQRRYTCVMSGAMSHRPRQKIADGWVAAALLALALAGCAGELGLTPGGSPSEVSPYAGVFTGEFVDGKPLYRLPPILVVGSRRSAGSDI